MSGGAAANAGIGLWVALPLLLLPLATSTPIAAILGGGALGAMTAWAGRSLILDTHSTAGIGLIAIPAGVVMGVVGVGILDRIIKRFAAREAKRAAGPAGLGDRLGAFVLDAAMLWVLLALPVRALSSQGHEVLAGCLAATASTLYFAFTMTLRGHSLGQWLLGLEVVDAIEGGKVPFSRSLPRGLALSLETVGVLILVLAPFALADALFVVWSGRSLLDRIFHTSVQSLKTAAPLPGPTVPPTGPSSLTSGGTFQDGLHHQKRHV